MEKNEQESWAFTIREVNMNLPNGWKNVGPSPPPPNGDLSENRPGHLALPPGQAKRVVESHGPAPQALGCSKFGKCTSIKGEHKDRTKKAHTEQSSRQKMSTEIEIDTA
ncbi:hypothetical protein H920_13658 [Fukomys damarensis]|uniref:Uncharacterized protein n=1 Tax=Fukomys damarensis TaxID=885580 RepID=A0A091D1K0_FUKDA|nr:hypothetical protein H920_13658 [Fukomys damarensis]